MNMTRRDTDTSLLAELEWEVNDIGDLDLKEPSLGDPQVDPCTLPLLEDYY